LTDFFLHPAKCSSASTSPGQQTEDELGQEFRVGVLGRLRRGEGGARLGEHRFPAGVVWLFGVLGHQHAQQAVLRGGYLVEIVRAGGQRRELAEAFPRRVTPADLEVGLPGGEQPLLLQAVGAVREEGSMGLGKELGGAAEVLARAQDGLDFEDLRVGGELAIPGGLGDEDRALPLELGLLAMSLLAQTISEVEAGPKLTQGLPLLRELAGGGAVEPFRLGGLLPLGAPQVEREPREVGMLREELAQPVCGGWRTPRDAGTSHRNIAPPPRHGDWRRTAPRTARGRVPYRHPRPP